MHWFLFLRIRLEFPISSFQLVHPCRAISPGRFLERRGTEKAAKKKAEADPEPEDQIEAVGAPFPGAIDSPEEGLNKGDMPAAGSAATVESGNGACAKVCLLICVSRWRLGSTVGPFLCNSM